MWNRGSRRHTTHNQLLTLQTSCQREKTHCQNQDLTSSQPTSGPASPGILLLEGHDPRTSAKKGRTSPLRAEECGTQEQQKLSPNEPSPCSPSSSGPRPQGSRDICAGPSPAYRGQTAAAQEGSAHPGWRQESKAPCMRHPEVPAQRARAGAVQLLPKATAPRVAQLM